ncbi:tail fiber domain-containing protein [Candidatus Woesearchaeota archaeon]|nr:tail fiber domain-containing protein [Candidatus Woesearchaeota archaeon]
MVIQNSTGNVGIGSGETNPATTLEVNGTIRAIRTISILNTIDVGSGATITSGGTYGGMNITTDSGLTSGPAFSVITYLNPGGIYNAALTVTAPGKVAVYSLAAATANTLCYDTTTVNGMNTLSTCSSSRRYKEDIKPLIVDKSKVFQLQPVSFKWKGRNESGVGLIAEDVEPVIPEIVGYYDGRIESVEYKLLTVYLLDIVKKQDKTIQELEQKNRQVESRLARLEGQCAKLC